MAQAHIFHPQPDENGQPLTLASPSVSTALSTWLTPSSDATLSVTDAGELPASLYNVAFSRRPQTPASVADWKKLNDRIQCEEPDYPETHGLFLTSGCVILEPDDRVWLVHPSNAFAGIKTTFPKGRLEPGLTLAVNAVKETFEESGLWVEPVACRHPPHQKHHPLLHCAPHSRYTPRRRLGKSGREPRAFVRSLRNA